MPTAGSIPILPTLLDLLLLSSATHTLVHCNAILIKPLSSLIPACALPCLDHFINTQYPPGACSRFSDVNCLCRTNSSSGLTFGEGALGCLYTYCQREGKRGEAGDVYGVCDSVVGALPRTHETITATFLEGPGAKTAMGGTETGGRSWTGTSLRDTMTLKTAVTTDPTTLTAATGSGTTAGFTSPRFTISASSTTNAGSAVSTVTVTDASAAHSHQSTPALDDSAIIGISVASGVAAAFIIGVILFFCFRRYRRRHQTTKPSFFEIGGFMTEPPEFSQPSTRRPTPGPTSHPSTSTRAHDERASHPPFETVARNPTVLITKPDQPGPAERETARMSGPTLSDSEQDVSPRSQSSQRTMSELLPDKPDLAWRQKNFRPMSGQTMFEDEEDMEEPRSMIGSSNSRADLSGLGVENRSRPNGQKKIGLPANPRALMHGGGSAFPNKTVSRTDPYGSADGNLSHEDVIDWYAEDSSPTQAEEDGPARSWQESDRPPRSDSLRPIQPAVDRNPRSSLEAFNFNEPIQPPGNRTSGHLRPLTPVREAWTPESQERADHGNSPVELPTPGAIEYVSQPRIIRPDDIRRVQVQIRRGMPQPKELRVPYSPNDYWVEHMKDRRVRPPDETVHAPVPDTKKRNACSPEVTKSRARPPYPDSPDGTPKLEHHFTPSKAGED